MTSWKPDLLLLGPGGVKGLVMLGALVALYDAKVLSDVRRIVGVSVGAIIGLLLAVGYTPREIISFGIDIDLFSGINKFSLSDIIKHSISETGLISANKIRSKLIDLVKDRLGFVPTLGQLYETTGYALFILAFNIDEEVGRFFNSYTDMHMSCIDAVMLSTNIPFVFHKISFEGKTYIDGALFNSYPIEYFDDGQIDILGISVDSAVTTLSPVTKYIFQVIYSGINQMRYRMIRGSSDRCRHLPLSIDIVDSTGFNITMRDKARMVVKGFEEGKKFISSEYEQVQLPEEVKI